MRRSHRRRFEYDPRAQPLRVTGAEPDSRSRAPSQFGDGLADELVKPTHPVAQAPGAVIYEVPIGAPSSRVTAVGQPTHASDRPPPIER